MKKHFCFDRLFNLWMILGIVFEIGAFVPDEGEGALGATIGIGIIGALFIIPPAVLHPCGYIFDEKSVTICYLFLPNERYLWNNISEIMVQNNSRKPIPFFSAVFELYATPEGKEYFYMDGQIRKTRRTKRYLERYWDGEIEGYLLKDIKQSISKWRNKRKAKQKKINSQHLTDEIVPLEREVRTRVREMLAPIKDRAALLGLDMRIKYIYETENGEELYSRPEEKYDYDAVIELIRKSDGKKTDFYIYLIKVRLGKKAYRGVVQDTMIDEIPSLFDEFMNDIEEKGFDVFCEENE